MRYTAGSVLRVATQAGVSPAGLIQMLDMVYDE